MRNRSKGRSRQGWVATLLLLLVGCLGCSTVLGYAGVVLGNLKSPIRYRESVHFPVNKPLRSTVYEELLALPADRPPVGPCLRLETGRLGRIYRSDCVDDFADFGEEGSDTLVAVAISGGGSRAARLAVHTMALLEERYRTLFPGESPLIEQVGAFSTVSGGSLYAYQVARRRARPRKPWWWFKVKPKAPETDFFCRVLNDRYTSFGTKHLGSFAFNSAFGFYGLSFLRSFFTDWSYLDSLAQGLSSSESPASLFLPFRIQSSLFFADLPERPRFLFNTTALETGGPFVLTQRITNVPSAPPRPRSARVDAHPSVPLPQAGRSLPRQPRRPLRSGYTLEEIGASPANFPVAYAAAASAAFPFGVKPLPLRKYTRRGNEEKLGTTGDVVSLADGGVYDNSGLTAIVDLYQYLVQERGVRRLVLVAINADASEYDADLPGRASGALPWYEGAEIGSPIPSLFAAADSLNLIHFTNKRRGEDAALLRLSFIESLVATQDEYERSTGQGKSYEVDDERQRLLRKYFDERRREQAERYVHYFPVNLWQLNAEDPLQIPGGQSFYESVQDVPTGYWLDGGADERLEDAARKILTTPQAAAPWKLGPSCRRDVERLDDAFAFAVARAARGRWQTEVGDVPEGWCEGRMPVVDPVCGKGSKEDGD